MEAINMVNVSTGENYSLIIWQKKIADLLDFCVIKGIPKDYCHTLELSLDNYYNNYYN